MNLQVLEVLGLSGEGKKVFALGKSQGGWIAARMALMALTTITGIVLLGTLMNNEFARSRGLGCYDMPAAVDPVLQMLTTNEATPSFEVPLPICDQITSLGSGPTCSDTARAFWRETIQTTYRGDECRKRVRMAAINLGHRDSLHARLFDIRCPVLWLHGSADMSYSIAHAEEEIGLFVNSPDATLQVMPEGLHLLAATHPEEVNAAVIKFVGRYA